MANQSITIYDSVDEKVLLTVTEQGPIGLSAYQVWLAQGNTGTQTDYINRIINSN